MKSIQQTFNQALYGTIDTMKLFITFGALILCGLVSVFFWGLALSAGTWAGMSLTFLPFFLSLGVLFSAGIFLIRMHAEGGKRRKQNLQNLLKSSWELLLGAAYVSAPIIFLYLILWMVLGVFALLGATPGLGRFFSIILSFGPFLLNVAILLLCIVNVMLLFFVAPIIAKHGVDTSSILQIIKKKFSKDIFGNIIAFLVALIPFFLSYLILVSAAQMSGIACATCHVSVKNIVEWFFIMIPFAGLLAPSVLFFFMYAAEAHE